MDGLTTLHQELAAWAETDAFARAHPQVSEELRRFAEQRVRLRRACREALRSSPDGLGRRQLLALEAQLVHGGLGSVREAGPSKRPSWALRLGSWFFLKSRDLKGAAAFAREPTQHEEGV